MRNSVLAGALAGLIAGVVFGIMMPMMMMVAMVVKFGSLARLTKFWSSAGGAAHVVGREWTKITSRGCLDGSLPVLPRLMVLTRIPNTSRGDCKKQPSHLRVRHSRTSH
jgi:hypothetical protein